MNPAERLADHLIVALDLPALDEALALADTLAGTVSFFKVGLELYTAAGPRAVEELRRRGHRVFLDLKLFDVPATVERAARVAASSGATFLTVHAGGATVSSAVSGAGGSGMGILAVTVLTSLDAADLRAMGCDDAVENLVMRRARLAHQQGAAGVVASPLEAGTIRAALPAPFQVVTPGIRPSGSEPGDQKRLATPAAALAAGADYLVVGRPISRAADPAAAAGAIVAEMQAALP